MRFFPLCSSSAGNAYLVEDGKSYLLIECGVSYRKLKKLVGFDLSLLSGCLVSHEHRDHSYCFRELIRDGVPLYASLGTATALDCDAMTTVEEGHVFSVGSFDVLPFRTFHDGLEPFGFLIRSQVDGEKMMFATDTANLQYHFPGVSIVAIEANFSSSLLGMSRKIPDKIKKRIANNHMEIDQVCTYLQSRTWDQLREIYLLHLSKDWGDRSLFADLVERVCPGIQVIVCPR